MPRAVYQPAAVGTERWPNARAVTGAARKAVARFQYVLLELILRELGVVLPVPANFVSLVSSIGVRPEPLLTWNSLMAGRPPPRNLPILATMYLPSGIQSGDSARLSAPFEICLNVESASVMVQIFCPPSRSDENTISAPLGEYRGCESKARPLVRRFASLPSNGTSYRSPSRSKTMRAPSGLTSRLIHVPDNTSSGIVRSTSRGSPLSLALSWAETADAASSSRPTKNAVANGIGFLRHRIRLSLQPPKRLGREQLNVHDAERVTDAADHNECCDDRVDFEQLAVVPMRPEPLP